MGSIATLHIHAEDDEGLVVAVGAWLATHGFGAALRSDAVPSSLRACGVQADAVGLGRANAQWSIVGFNGLRLGARVLDEDVVRPLADRLRSRVVLFTGQTTSDVYQLVVFDAGTCVRRIAVSDGECLVDEGEPLAGEREGAFARADDDDDDAPTALQDAAAIGAAMGFELWPDLPLVAPVFVWRRRGLLSRVLGR